VHQPVVLADAVRRISEDSGGALELYIVLDQGNCSPPLSEVKFCLFSVG